MPRKSEQDYLHGFSQKEQERLIHQSLFLEPYVFQGIDLEFKERVLEVGSGVGAQTKILCRRFPNLQIDCIDLSKEQIKTARIYLKDEIQKDRVHIYQGDAQKLSLRKKSYEAAFLCWFLEHVPDPLKVLVSVRKHLESGAKIYCSEVFNQTLFLEPYSPAFLKYWFEFNDYQWTIKGHPFVGVQLGHYLNKAGYKDIHCEPRHFHFDSRLPERRAAFMDFFFKIMLSAEESLLQAKRVDKYLIDEMKREMAAAIKAPDAVFYYSFMRATAIAP